MPDKDNQPNEEQVQNANKAEDAKWQGDFDEEDLKIPYKAEVENTQEVEEPAATVEVVEENEEYESPAPVITVEDPGEYQPADYSFEVTLKDGKTHKITTVEEADKLADDPDNFETPRQLSEFIRKQMKMSNNLDRDKEAYDKQKKTFDDQSQTEQQRIETVNVMTSEFNYLVGKGLLPAIDPQYLEADWTDPEVAKQPGVKEQMQLLDYMVKENKVRAKAGVRPLTSVVDTFNAWQQDTGRIQEAEQARKDAEDRKAAGARIGASSPAQQGSYVPKGIAVGNPNVLKRGASIWEN